MAPRFDRLPKPASSPFAMHMFVGKMKYLGMLGDFRRFVFEAPGMPPLRLNVVSDQKGLSAVAIALLHPDLDVKFEAERRLNLRVASIEVAPPDCQEPDPGPPEIIEISPATNHEGAVKLPCTPIDTMPIYTYDVWPDSYDAAEWLKLLPPADAADQPADELFE